MIRREHFCNKLRDLGFRFKRETERVQLYRKPGGQGAATVPKRELIDPAYVRVTLRQAGCDSEQIERFIAEYTNQ